MRSEYPLIFERSREGRRAYDLPVLDVPEADELLPSGMINDAKLNLPEIAEVDLVRHYTNLSRRNFGVDNGFYPLGSCTMKYNPKINEEVAHPGAQHTDHDQAIGGIAVGGDSADDLERRVNQIERRIDQPRL